VTKWCVRKCLAVTKQIPTTKRAPSSDLVNKYLVVTKQISSTKSASD